MTTGTAEGCVPPGTAAPAPCPCRHLISLDYDGTLRAESGAPIPPDFFHCMAEWRRHGVRWGINTGRALDYLLQDILPCSPVLPDFICTCERYVYLAAEDGRLLPAEAHNATCRLHNLELRATLTKPLHALLRRLRCTHPELQWELAASDPLSIEAADSATMDALVPHLQPLATTGITIQRAGRYLRFADSRHNKGTALAYVMQAWNVAHENLFIMGDGHNDLDAFRMFPRAFCATPATAHPEVADWMRRQHTGYISPTSGVLDALRTWFDARVTPTKT